MGWPSTERYDVACAPGSLGFVQDVLNTRSAGRPRLPDLLADLDSAQQWLDGAWAHWCAVNGVAEDRVLLQESDLDPLRDLRVDLHTVLGARMDPGVVAVPMRPAALTARMGPDGQVSLEPRGEGWRRVSAIIVLEAFVAQQQDTWRRLKVCRNERCGGAFYDRSRNSSAVWHDARVCGNAVNLRASRARRRKVETVPPARDGS